MRWLCAILFVVAGCNKPAPPAKEGQKCYYGDPSLGSCDTGLFCKPTVIGPGQFEMEKVGLDKTVAIGTCKQPVKLGKPCDEHDLCEGGKCTHAKPGGPGTCEGG